jgi:hypothetical protein
MRNGNFQTVTFRFEGQDTLWLTTKATDDGPTANPVTFTLIRLE